MAKINKANLRKILPQLPKPGVCRKFDDDRGFLQWIADSLFAVEPTIKKGLENVRFFRGTEPPRNLDRKDLAIVAIEDTNGFIVAIQMWAGGRWVDVFRKVIGEGRHYFAGAIPDGWFKADGNNGTIDIKTNNSGLYDPMGNESYLFCQRIEH